MKALEIVSHIGRELDQENVELDQENVENLRRSAQARGFLQPIVVDADSGEVLIGRHRKQADSNWPTVKVPVRSRLDRLLIRLHGNVQRKVKEQETQKLLIEIAEELERQGVVKAQICEKMCPEDKSKRLVPYTPQYVRWLLPTKYKMASKARVEVKPEREFANLVSQDNMPSETEMRGKIGEVRTALESLSHGSDNKPAFAEGCLCSKCPNLQNCW